jgi:trimethylamine--corrinoid protein Co-methyltransferase
MISAATVEMGHYYGLPVDVYGFCTNAHSIDVQNGYERTINAILPLLAGANEISGIGEMEGGVNASLAQIVIDDEILTSLYRILHSFDINQETLAVDEINTVMDGPQNYLAQKHTIKYLRSGEILNPMLASRESWSQWIDNDQSKLAERAQDRVDNILEKHEVPPLSENQMAAMKKIIRSY